MKKTLNHVKFKQDKICEMFILVMEVKTFEKYILKTYVRLRS
jgi:hypothetical protein